MTRDELIEAMAADAGISKNAADRALHSFCDHTGAALLAGEVMQVKGFGTFKARTSRRGRNLHTGNEVGSHVEIRFRAGTPLKTRLAPLLETQQPAAA